MGDEKSQKITSDCYNFWVEIYGCDIYIADFYLGTDGETVYYFEHMQEVAENME